MNGISVESQLRRQCRLLEKKLRSKRSGEHLALWLELAHLLCRLGEINRLKACTERVFDLPNLPPDFVFQLTTVMLSADLHHEAFDELSKFLKRQPDSPVLVSQLAEISDRLGKERIGLDFIEGLTAGNRCNPLALLAKASLLRKSGEPEDALAILEVLSKEGYRSPNPSWSVNLWNEIFRSRDDLADYKGAYEALLRRKEINLRWIQPGLTEHLRRKKEESYQKMLQVIAALDKGTLLRWRDEATRDHNQPAFLVGHPRSGTTLLENVLESHSKMVSSDERPSFQLHVIETIQSGFRPKVDDDTTPKLFCTYLDELPEKTRDQVRARYFKEIKERLNPGEGETLVLDKNPAITDGLVVINRLFPKGKIVFALRDPRAVAWSAFTLPMVGTSWIGSFWNSLEDAAIAWGYLWDIWESFREKLPASQFIEARYEDTVEDVKKQGKAVTEFLGLEWEEEQERFYEHALSKVVRSPTYADVSKPIYSKAKNHWRNYEEYMTPAIEKLKPYLSKLGYD